MFSAGTDDANSCSSNRRPNAPRAFPPPRPNNGKKAVSVCAAVVIPAPHLDVEYLLEFFECGGILVCPIVFGMSQPIRISLLPGFFRKFGQGVNRVCPCFCMHNLNISIG